MTAIRLYNTRTRAKQGFTPIDAEDVRLYVCGPTVYDRAHLGNARPVVVFDTLFRLLRHEYGADHVTYVRNFTDVDDKINATAVARQQAGAPGTLEDLIRQRTEETIGWYHADMDALGNLRPTHEPRATEYIGNKGPDGTWGHMIGMIKTLIDKGYAYVVRDPSNNPPKEFVIANREAMHSETALFEVHEFNRYGELSGRSLDDMIAGARVEEAPYKRDPMDFVLWKPSDDSLPGWDSPWGRGRPGWHIECSAMSKALLGATFDIHGGGLDLQFPHHENEIAQSCCANDTEFMARFWMHNEMLLVEGKKMSKSLGNFFSVRELLDQGFPGEVIRFVMLSTHYRKPMDWTDKKAREASNALENMHRLVLSMVPDATPEPSKVDAFFVEALAQDLNTSEVIRHLHGFASLADDEENPQRFGAAKALGDALSFLGLFNPELAKRHTPHFDPEQMAQLAERLASLRADAIARKDFAPVDALKSALIAAGVEVRMSKAGVELVPGAGFDAAKLEGLQ